MICTVVICTVEWGKQVAEAIYLKKCPCLIYANISRINIYIIYNMSKMGDKKILKHNGKLLTPQLIEEKKIFIGRYII